MLLGQLTLLSRAYRHEVANLKREVEFYSQLAGNLRHQLSQPPHERDAAMPEDADSVSEAVTGGLPPDLAAALHPGREDSLHQQQQQQRHHQLQPSNLPPAAESAHDGDAHGVSELQQSRQQGLRRAVSSPAVAQGVSGVIAPVSLESAEGVLDGGAPSQRSLRRARSAARTRKRFPPGVVPPSPVVGRRRSTSAAAYMTRSGKRRLMAQQIEAGVMHSLSQGQPHLGYVLVGCFYPPLCLQLELCAPQVTQVLANVRGVTTGR